MSNHERGGWPGRARSTSTRTPAGSWGASSAGPRVSRRANASRASTSPSGWSFPAESSGATARRQSSTANTTSHSARARMDSSARTSAASSSASAGKARTWRSVSRTSSASARSGVASADVDPEAEACAPSGQAESHSDASSARDMLTPTRERTRLAVATHLPHARHVTLRHHDDRRGDDAPFVDSTVDRRFSAHDRRHAVSQQKKQLTTRLDVQDILASTLVSRSAARRVDRSFWRLLF